MRPKLITVGGSLNLFPHPVSEVREIADEVGSDVGAVKQAVFRAVRKLRVHMGSLKGERT